jgi:hypothetical protein
MRYVTILMFCLVAGEVMAQGNDTTLFTEQNHLDTTTTEAEPVGGYKQLLKFLGQTVSAGDTVGKKSWIPLYAIRFRINKEGGVDTAYVAIPHAACSIHRIIAKELLGTKWLPAKKRGEAVPFEDNLYGRIQVTRTVQKKLRCKWG